MCKTCSKCGKEYCGERKKSFHKRKTSKDGFSTICKYCKLRSRHVNVDINEKGELLCVTCGTYKKPTEFDTDPNAWFRDNKDRRCKVCKKAQYVKRRISNRQGGVKRLLVERFCGLRDRAKCKGLVLDFTKDFLYDLWEKQKGLCAVSGVEMTYTMFSGRVPTNVSVDRKDTTLGYLKDNVQLVCMAVNQMKSDLSHETLLYFCAEILKNAKKNSNS